MGFTLYLNSSSSIYKLFYRHVQQPPKRQIVQSIYENNNYKQEDVRQIVQQTLDIVRDALIAGRNIELRKFGVFEIQVRKARVGRNPNRPETDVVIPRRAVVKFKAGKELKEGLTDLDLDAIEFS